MITINIGNTDENADWLKFLAKGKYKKQEQAIYEEMQRKYEADAKEKDTA